MLSKHNTTYEDLLNNVQKDKNVLGVILAGSRARNMQNDDSDWDTYIIFKDSLSSQDILKYQKEYNEKYDAFKLDISNKALQTINEFSHYAEINTDYYYDRYNLVHAKIEFDKTDGEIIKLLHKINSLSEEEQKQIIDTNLGDYITHVYLSMKSYNERKYIQSSLDASESISYLLTSLFALENRVRPFNKYLEWELKQFPLQDLKWEEKEFLQMLEKIIKEDDMKTMQDIYIAVEKLARNKGFGYKYDEWGEKLNYVKTANVSA